MYIYIYIGHWPVDRFSDKRRMKHKNPSDRNPDSQTKDRCVNTTGVFLEYDDPRMEESRQQEHLNCVEQNMPKELLLNYDQTFKERYRAKKKKQFKQRFMVGFQPRKQYTKKQERALASLGTERPRGSAEATEEMDARLKKRRSCNKQHKYNLDVRNDPVRRAREGITICTSVWGNGDRGPMFFNTADGQYLSIFGIRFKFVYIYI